MANASKQKGKSWERDVANYLTELYGEKFLRVPNSGAFVGGQNTQRKEVLHEGQIRIFKGDIIPGQSFQKLNAECKSYKDFPFHQLLQGTKIRLLDDWIEQLMQPADENDFNILFMKFNNKGKYIGTEFRNHPPLAFVSGIRYDSVKHGPWYFSDFNNFWTFNKDVVKTLAG